ncbi:MAG TPA: hypothetical protein VFM18_17255 [Methanosarcina sp.]|nr:hypothetical protein [Methanosarcina sp.]
MSIEDQTGLHFFTGYSLVDITATGVTRSSDPDNLERNQQRNWETVLQCMSLRTQPLHISKPRSDVLDLADYDFKFGDLFEGKHRVWYWSWAVERAEVYDLPGKPLGALQSDFEQVPIITFLTDTARFMLPIFYPYGSIKNIYFEQVRT